MPSQHSFSTTFGQKNMLEIKASTLPHMLKLWLAVSNCMFPVKTSAQKILTILTAKYKGDSGTAMKLRSIRPPSVVGDNIGFKEIVELP